MYVLGGLGGGTVQSGVSDAYGWEIDFGEGRG